MMWLQEMNDVRILFFEGAPGAGKSCLSQHLARQLEASGRCVYWLEEHELNEAVFAPFHAQVGSGEGAAITSLLVCWQSLLARIDRSADILCLDGAFFHSTIKVLLAHGVSRPGIDAYLKALYPLLARFRPCLIHLVCDVARVLQETIAERGHAWAALVAADVADYPVQRAAQQTGESGLIAFFVESQLQLATFATAYPFARLRIDTTARDWAGYQAALCTALGVQPDEPVRFEDCLAQYTGIYQPPDGFPEAYRQPFQVELVGDELRLHMGFTRNFRLEPLARNRFAIIGRPLEIEFVRDDEGQVCSAIYPFVPDRRFVCERLVTT
ncbi:hypothetical protein [Jeongeupia sp. USM3]|uniref:hypothetical protein n=1 Tax=Jeongeupia sp. USM3 TaxID=1906741 RepID=UPI00089DE5AB|nr:hypothetical protein [Jeongeupia sp. USM3]AOX99543.1 hypothetical protein BJP62_03175 [Jeongeupia sp. USM3]